MDDAELPQSNAFVPHVEGVGSILDILDPARMVHSPLTKGNCENGPFLTCIVKGNSDILDPARELSRHTGFVNWMDLGYCY